MSRGLKKRTSAPRTFTVVAVILAAVAFLASYMPTLRATAVDPVTALREE